MHEGYVPWESSSISALSLVSLSMSASSSLSFSWMLRVWEGLRRFEPERLRSRDLLLGGLINAAILPLVLGEKVRITVSAQLSMAAGVCARNSRRSGVRPR